MYIEWIEWLSRLNIKSQTQKIKSCFQVWSTWEALHITIATAMVMPRWLIVDLTTWLSLEAANLYTKYHVLQESVSLKFECLK